MSKPVVISKEMIDDAAFNLVRTGGIETLSVRNIARDLGCSTKPVYRTYGNMEKLRQAVNEKVLEFMKENVSTYRRTGHVLLDLGIANVLCAIKEKHLFLYICQTKKYPHITFYTIANDNLRALYAEQIGRKCPRDKLEKMAAHCGLFTFGLAMSCCFGIFTPTEDEIQAILQNFLNTQIKDI